MPFSPTEQLALAEQLAIFREALCANTQPCPACGEAWQIQLVSWIAGPVVWKCRTCKYKWEQDRPC
jgi:hypothetical protein